MRPTTRDITQHFHALLKAVGPKGDQADAVRAALKMMEQVAKLEEVVDEERVKAWTNVTLLRGHMDMERVMQLENVALVAFQALTKSLDVIAAFAAGMQVAPEGLTTTIELIENTRDALDQVLNGQSGGGVNGCVGDPGDG